ncbi:MAG TPA: hypothetical protein DCE42_00265 [Myxococcales bacterium]|nr:hypothetical protein [Myxococcales bacterium]
MIACPWCGYSHPNQLTAQSCINCHQSFADIYLCSSQSCAMHRQYQGRNRHCQSCGNILIGEFSGRDIRWGHAIYRVREYIGGGGMGEVYRGIEQNHANTYQREVAIKFNKNMMDQDIVQRFQREVQVLSMLNDPHNIRVYTYGELYEERQTGSEVRAQFMVMELLRGYDLNEIIKNQRESLDPTELVRLFIEICGALSEAHRKGIIHRDLKPHNIMVQDSGGEKFAKVFDFGLSRNTNSMDDRLSTSGVVMGTFRYMSPEQALGEECDQRTDIVSLGVVLYEALAGRTPFDAKNLFELFMLHQEGAPPIGINPDLEDIIMRMLAHDKEERYNTIDEVKSELKLLLGDSLSGSLIITPTGGGDVLTRAPSVRLHSQAMSDRSSKAYAIDRSQVNHLRQAPQGIEDSASALGNVAPPSGNRGLVLALSAILVVVIGAFAAYVLTGPKKIQTDNKHKFTLQTKTGTQVSPRRLPQAQPKTTPRALPRTQPLPERRPGRVRRRRYRRRYRTRRRQYKRIARYIPPRRRVIERKAPPIVRRATPPPVITIERRAPPVRRVVVVKVAPRPRRPAAPRLATCPAQSRQVQYGQLDRALGRRLNTQTARKLNRAASSTVYDAGLRLSQSWRQAPVLCKRSYLCGRISRYVNAYCRTYRPYSHCSGYRARQRGKYFVCAR